MSPRKLLHLLCVLLWGTLLAGAAEPYGLNSRAPVGPFLNNTVPHIRPGNSLGEYYTTEAFPNITFEDPTFMIPEPGTNRLYVCGRQGTIHHFVNDPNVITKTLFLNLTAKTQGFEDCGLLGMAFHPQWRQTGSPNRGYVYVWYQYTTNRVFPPPNSDRPDSYLGTWMRLSRFRVPDGSLVADPSSELVLINQFDRHLWHNGGGMFFGPDGFLYIPVGDEGGIDDEFNQAQRMDGGLFSGVLRIDIDMDPSRSHPIRRQPQSPPGSPPSYTQNYYIPNDNPWQDAGGGILEEFYAVGLRSPHRMTRDPVTGLIWLGDIGQNRCEEVNIIERGGNYQWSYREGNFEGPKTKPSPLIGVDKPPLYQYTRENGDTCVIGGYVYRGSELPELYGKYLLGDNISGRLWALTYNGPNNPPSVVYLCNMPPGHNYLGLSSFGIDQNNEVYMLQMGAATRIVKLARTGSSAPPAPPLLTATGVFNDTRNIVPAQGLIPYDVNSPLWSDGAHKTRWMAVPNDGAPYAANEKIGFAATGEWTFPAGTVFVKHFEIATNENNPTLRRRLETRLLVRDTNGGVYGITYKWRPDNSDADLLSESVREDIVVQTSSGVRTQTWFYPSPDDCLSCHTPAANHVLGVKTRHLNGNYTYPGSGVSDNQLRSLNHVGLLNPAINENEINGFARTVPLTETSAPLETRVRSYLDSNCAQCHRPGGVQGNWDGRFDTPLTSQNIINGSVNNTFGIPNVKVIAPGRLDRSLMYLRINTHDVMKMPPLARNLIDTTAVDAVAEWILSLAPGGLPAPWLHEDIGSVGIAGDASYFTNAAAFSVSGSGTDIWGNEDSFHFVYQEVSGDGEIIARVTSVGNSNPWAKAGVMMRETLSPGARNAMNTMTFENGVEFQWRPVPNFGSSYVQGPPLTTPSWLRLTRTGAVFRASHSLDGMTWTEYANTEITMGSDMVVGLAVSAVDNTALNASSFDSVTVRPNVNGDTDGDGMPNDWELANGLNPASAADAAEDSDGDGMSNLSEYKAGTDPRNASSAFRISQLTRLTNDVVLRFNVTTGRTYAVERASGLPPATWTTVTNLPAGTNTVLNVTNKGAGAAGQNYFRVRVED